MCSARHLSPVPLSGLAPSPTPPRIADDAPAPRPPPRTMHHLLSPPLSVRSRPETPLCADHHLYPAAATTVSSDPLHAPTPRSGEAQRARQALRRRRALVGRSSGGVRWWAGLRREQRGARRGQLAVALEVLSLRLEAPQLPIEAEQLDRGGVRGV